MMRAGEAETRRSIAVSIDRDRLIVELAVPADSREAASGTRPSRRAPPRRRRAVEQRDHLRHRGHLDRARRVDADRGADATPDDQRPLRSDRALERVAISAIAMPTIEIRLPRARSRRAQ
jgi:hypothetical protein